MAGSTHAAPAARGVLKRLDRVVRRLSIRFDDIFRRERRERIDLAEMRGRPTVVHVYSMTEGAEPPELEELLAARKRFGDAVQWIGIHQIPYRAGSEKLARDLEALGVDWPHMHVTGGDPFSKPWFSGREPTYYVLDADGVVRAVAHRMRNASAWLEKLCESG